MSTHIKLGGLRWLGHVWRLLDILLPCHALFSVSPHMMWQCGMGKCAASVGKLGVPPPRSKDPKDLSTSPLETLKDVATSCEQW